MAPGTTVGRYVILDVVGEGGMGVVYAAYDHGLDRKIALKLVRADGASETSRGQLLDEARAMAKLAHPSVVGVHDVGTFAGQLFVAMELVPGVTLRAWLAEERPWRDVVARFVEAGRGLAAAHAVGLVHRDFKPENVLVDRDGRARVTDFGLAGGAGEHAGGGTPAYMSPEQHARAPLDARSDQYAFSVALWEGVFGTRPFDAATEPELVDAKQRGEPQAPARRDVPSKLRDALARGMAPRAEDRWPSIDALLDAIEPRPSRSRYMIAAVATLAIGGIVGALVIANAADVVDPCRDAGAGLSAIWNAERRDALVRRFTTIGAPERAIAIADKLERWVADWSSSRIEACRATRVRGDSELVLDRRTRCLDRASAELSATVELFVNGDAGVVARAADAAAGLPVPARCAAATTLGEEQPLPADPAVRERALVLDRETARARAAFRAGRFAETLPEVERIATEAERIGWRPLEARAQLVLGQLLWRGDRGAEAALARLWFAVGAAHAGGEVSVAADAWLDILFIESTERSLPRAAELLPAVHGAVERTRDRGSLAMLEDRVGMMMTDLKRYAEARMALERALSIWRELYGEKSAQYATVIQHLALLDQAEHGAERALPQLQASAETLAAALGPEHPDALIALSTYGIALYQLERLAEAEAVYRRGLATVERVLGPRSTDAAGYLTNIALVLRKQGKHEDALAVQRRALAIIMAIEGKDAPSAISALTNLALTERDLKKFDDAFGHLDRALALTIELRGADHSDVDVMQWLIAGTHQAAGDFPRSLARFEQLLAVTERKGNAENIQQVRDKIAEVRRAQTQRRRP